jgi:enamine deaminase RidA (YjgF/YER057c/UK114 family)
MTHRILQPTGWPRPAGYANGIAAQGTMVFVAGQIGWDAEQRLASGFVAQVRQALANVVAVLAEAGAGPEHVVRMTWYVVDMESYRTQGAAIGAAYREIFGRHYPAMSAVGVASLVERDALMEIEVTAVVPGT